MSEILIAPGFNPGKEKTEDVRQQDKEDQGEGKFSDGIAKMIKRDKIK